MIVFLVFVGTIIVVSLIIYWGEHDRWKYEKLHHKQREEICRKVRIAKLEKELGFDITEELTEEERQALLVVEVWK